MNWPSTCGHSPGPTPCLRAEQLAAVTAVVADRRRTLLVARTGFREVGGLLLRHPHVPRPRVGSDRRRVATARPHARPGGRRRASRAWSPSRSTPPTSNAWAEIEERVDARRDRPAPHRSRAARQRRIPPTGVRHDADPGLRARLRRGPLHLRLGPRLPARLPATPAAARRAAVMDAGVGHHGDGEPAGDRRRRRAVGRRHLRPAHVARSRVTVPVGRRSARRCPPPRVAGRGARRAAGVGHRLLPDRRPSRHRSGLAAQSRPSGGGVHRVGRARPPTRARVGFASQ